MAIAVLPDHLHAILTLPPGDADFSGCWRRIKSLFTRALVARGVHLTRNGKGEYDLWQRRFWEHTIKDLADLERHIDYIHFNPVRHGLVGRAWDWPYSSFDAMSGGACCRQTGAEATALAQGTLGNR